MILVTCENDRLALSGAGQQNVVRKTLATQPWESCLVTFSEISGQICHPERQLVLTYFKNEFGDAAHIYIYEKLFFLIIWQ